MRPPKTLRLCVVALCLLPAALMNASAPAPATETKAVMDHDLLEATIPRLEGFYATHRYSVRQVTQWYLDRVARYDGRYRAIITVNGAAALAAADVEDAMAGGKGFHPGPLFGIPMVIKSNTSIQGLVTNDGWKGFMIPGHELVAPQDAAVVKKLKAAGAILIGQTNMPDFAASDTNKSTAFGRTGNAYDVRFSPGGSSGGTVTAVTANFAMLGTGTDTGNSIRMPSGTSAVVGMLPTRGLVSIAGIAPLDWLLDNTGPIARNVTDAAIALGVMAVRIRRTSAPKDLLKRHSTVPIPVISKPTRSRASGWACRHLLWPKRRRPRPQMRIRTRGRMPCGRRRERSSSRRWTSFALRAQPS